MTDYYQQTGRDGYSQADRDEDHFSRLHRREQYQIANGICTTCGQRKPDAEQGNGEVRCQGCTDRYMQEQITIYHRYYPDFPLTGNLAADMEALHAQWRAEHPLFTD